MDKLTCPYCGHKNDVPEECYEGDTDYECECSGCDDIFMFTLSYLPCYEEFATPCLNDGKHNWEKIIGAPREYFENRRRCSYCGEEKTIKA